MERKIDFRPRHRFLDWLPVCGKSCHRRIIYVLWAFLFILPFQQYYSFQFEFTRWDLLLFTGVMTFILGLNLTTNLPRRFKLTLNRLILRGVIKVSPEKKRLLFEHLEQHAQDWEIWGHHTYLSPPPVANQGAMTDYLLTPFLRSLRSPVYLCFYLAIFKFSLFFHRSCRGGPPLIHFNNQF